MFLRSRGKKMGFFSRILGEVHIREELSSVCSKDCIESNDSGVCQEFCVEFCPKICKDVEYYLSPPVAIHQKSKRILIITASVIASAVLLVCLLAFYFNSRRRRSRARSSRLVVVPTNEQAHNDHGFFDEDHHGIIIDHPVWYIRTIGLQPSVINSITVCRYRKGDGLVEGRACSVCLSEFEEDETLRLLPKCNHAFHLPCIDTWLRSHTNCPLCRAPIVVANVAVPSSSVSSSGVNNNNMQNPDEISVAIPEEDGETVGDDQEIGQGREDNVVVSSNGESEAQRVRRSMSVDSLSDIGISEAATDLAKEKESNSRENGNGKLRKLVGSGSSSFLKRQESREQIWKGGLTFAHSCEVTRSENV